jgi:hypothetical protein
MRILALVDMVGGSPDIDQSVTPYHGHVHCGSVEGVGVYLISGRPAQLSAIDALPQVVGIVILTKNENIKYPELEDTITSNRRTKLNNWLIARDLPTIPVGWTYRKVVKAIMNRAHSKADIETEDVEDSND